MSFAKHWPRHSLLLGAGGGSAYSTTYHPPAQHPLRDGPTSKGLGVQRHLSENRHKCVYYFGYFRPIAELQERFQLAAKAALCSQGPEPYCLAEAMGFLEGSSASIKPLSFSLTILHLTVLKNALFRNKRNFSFSFAHKTLAASDTGMGFWQLTLCYQVIYHQSNTGLIVYYTSTDEILHEYITQVMSVLQSACPNMSCPAEALSHVLGFSCFI